MIPNNIHVHPIEMNIGTNNAIPMVAPVLIPRASDKNNKNTAQEPPQALAEGADADKDGNSAYRSANADITHVDVNLETTFIAAKYDCEFTTRNNPLSQTPQQTNAANLANFMAAVNDPNLGGSDDDSDSDHIQTADEFEAALREFTTLYDMEDAEEPQHAQTRNRKEINTYADFMAAVNDPNLGDSDDSDAEH